MGLHLASQASSGSLSKKLLYQTDSPSYNATFNAKGISTILVCIYWDNSRYRVWQQLFDLEVALNAGRIAFNDTGGENGDLNYDMTYSVTKDGDNITLKLIGGYRGTIFSVYGY